MEHKNDKIEVELKFFMDDLEVCMINDNFPVMLLGTDKAHKNAGEFIEEYIKRHFKLNINNIKDYDFVRFKASKNCYDEPCNPDLLAVWCYLEVPNIQKVSSVEVYSDLIVEQYPDHKMVCKFVDKRKTKNFVLDESTKKEKLTF
jgi:hypothetical protein